MERAAVLIGVARAGRLPELHAVYSAVKQMADWAQGQGIRDDMLKVLSDEHGEVRVHHVADAVDALVKRGTIKQLIIHFSGHGIYNRGEMWLLSRAPTRAEEAVNVEGSVLLARHCGIPHIVMISDACRTAAAGIQGTHVTGTEVFPNDPVGGREAPVDTFFACSRGHPSYEVRSADASAREFSAIYTETLAECLRGEYAEAIAPAVIDGQDSHVVRARRLRDCLSEEVPRRLGARLQRALTIIQHPDARVTSDDAWLSKLTSAPPAGVPLHLRARRPARDLVAELVGAALEDRVGAWRDTLSRSANEHPVLTYFDDLLEGAVAHPVAALAHATGPAGNMVLTIDHDSSVILPDWLAARPLEFRILDGQLVDIGTRALPARDLAVRLALCAAASHGVLHLNGDLAATLTEYLGEGELEPASVLYAAYGLHEMQRGELLQQLRHRLRAHGNFLFDLELLVARDAADLSAAISSGGLPLLSRGWPLMRALRARNGLVEVERYLKASYWTVLEPAGVTALRALQFPSRD